MCETIEDVLKFLKKEKFVSAEIQAQSSGGYRVEIQY